MLSFTAPGCDPGEPGDDQGPPHRIRERFVDASGCNTGEVGISWADTEREDPGDGRSRYDFSRLRPPERELRQPNLIVSLDFFGNPWAERFRFTDPVRYNRALSRWATAACRYVREKWGASVFMTGGNERDLVAPETYRPRYPDWHFFYIDPIKAMHHGMKRAHRDNKLIIGNLCYSDRDHIGALYCAGAKGNFEILAIHAYGPRGCGLDMEQVVESHEELVYRGDPDIPIILVEGWSAFPLPDSIDKDPQWRRGPRPYTPQEIEHYRQSVLDGWRNLTTPRPGQYDPKWVCGARYFVLNDHWGGRNWAARAKPIHDEAGKLKGFNLDGYFIGTGDPDYIKPFLRPWGLIDIEGKPKGDTVAAFPPYLPRLRFAATLSETLPTVGYNPRRPEVTVAEAVAGKPYQAEVLLTNLEDRPMTQLHFRLSEKCDADFPGGYGFVFVDGILQVNTDPNARREVRAKLVGPPSPARIAPRQTMRLRYEVTFAPSLARTDDNGRRHRVRPYADLYYVWNGRPYHTDAWLPRVAVRLSE